MNLLSKILSLPILAYKKYISPHTADHCRFEPTCSTYALEALKVHGPFKGSILALWRIIRCNPLGGMGFDPVPPAGEFKLVHFRKGRKGHF